MEYLTSYLSSILIALVLISWRSPDMEVRPALFLATGWPLTLLLVLGSFVLGAMKWNCDVATVEKQFAFRLPTNSAVRGCAVTVFGTEIQFWKNRTV